MLFYDFEVFKYDWLVVVGDAATHEEHVIINSRDELQELYDDHKYDIWVGFNSRHYDQYILKGILCDFNPKEINDFIILQGRDGWQYTTLFNQIPLINYDVMPNPPVGLKTMEGFLGTNIKETSVPFDIDRPLTDREIEQTVFYCRHDVENTMRVFVERKDEFNAMYGIVKAFHLPLACIGDTEARITSKVLQCVKHDFHDEFDYYFLPCLKLDKYRGVRDWFAEKSCEAKALELDGADPTHIGKQAWYKKQSLKVDVAGVPHVFGFGGLHGAPDRPIHRKGLLLHVDVGSYYPSMLIGWGLVTRAAEAPEQYKNVYDTRMALKAAGKKKEQAPYKKLLNALSGAMKDITNPAFDPRNNNIMCINGQLMLLDLIEHLEKWVPGFELIQSNTDGLIIQIPDTDEAFQAADDVCYDWECRCSTDKCNISLGLDVVAEIWQKDVNNYLWIDADGKVERKGAYVKELSRIDNDLPIINTALVDYMTKGVPVERTIGLCMELIQFQKIVKLSDKYRWVEHEQVDRENLRYAYKSYRVFASRRPEDGRILKCGGTRGKPEKFGNTPDKCFINNDDITDAVPPDYLDREWYIKLAKKRLRDYGVQA